jgi:hypothetical protein
MGNGQEVICKSLVHLQLYSWLISAVQICKLSPEQCNVAKVMYLLSNVQIDFDRDRLNILPATINLQTRPRGTKIWHTRRA